MNTIAATLLLDLTSSARFPGQLNMDISEIVMNLVPYAGMQFLVSALTPYPGLADDATAPRSLDGMFRDAFAPEHQLLRADPKGGTYLACALAARGDVEMSEMRRNIDRARAGLDFVWWNHDGWKVGHCSVAPPGQARALLCLANNSVIGSSLAVHHARFAMLYRRKAHLHHYLEHMTKEELDSAAQTVQDTIDRYREIAHAAPPEEGIPRDAVIV
jgi:tubulin epsilon